MLTNPSPVPSPLSWWTMQLNVMSDDGSTLQIQAIGQMHLVDFGAAAAPVKSLLEASGYARKVLMDLSQVTYMDSVVHRMAAHVSQALPGGGGAVPALRPPVDPGDPEVAPPGALLNLAEDVAIGRALARGGRS